MKSRPRVDRSATSYHTAQYSISEYDEDEDTLALENRYPTPASSRASPSKPLPLRISGDGNGSSRVSPRKSLRHSQAQSRDINPSYFAWRKSVELVGRNGTVSGPGGLISPASSAAGVQSVSFGQAKQRLAPLATDYDSTSDDGEALFSESGSPITRTTPEGDRHVEELMGELRDVSAELAASIRREMDLEDELERFRIEPGLPNPSRRTSDYFSESGVSSMKLPTADSQSKIEALETMRRKVEQEKAKLRLAMAEKAEADLIQRRALEMHVQSLEEQLQGRDDVEPAAQQSREEEIELAMNEVRQHLEEEREMKQQVQTLLEKLQQDHEACVLERDNLRDETIPRLRARIEGLESESTDLQKVQYENTQLQQELQMMRSENQTLIEARRLQVEQTQRFRSITEEEDFGSMSPLTSPKMNLSRSQSIARSRSLKRPNSVANSPNPATQQPPMPSETIKDVEDQRDALHMTLRTLLLRQEVLNRQHAKQLRALQAERDEALRGSSTTSTHSQEVQRLRNDFSYLRQRADDASEQKWQCEKGLSGLRMDLERTQQETESMRDLAAQSEVVDEAIARSVAAQRSAAQRIVDIEANLRSAEEKVTAAQTQSEEALASEEDHFRTLKEAELEKRRRGVGRTSAAAKDLHDSAQKKTLLADLRKQRGATAEPSCTAKFEILRDCVRKLEDVVGQAEGDIESLVAELNGLHAEMGKLAL